MIFASVSINFFVEKSYYDTFRSRIEERIKYWGIKDEPTTEEIRKYLEEDRNDIYLFLVTEYKTLTVINRKTDEIVYSNDRTFEKDEAVFIDEILKSENYLSVLSNNIGDKAKLTTFGDRVFFDYARPKGDFVLYFRYYKEEWESTINRFNEIIQITFLVATLVSFVFGYLLSKTITVPIVKLMHKARKIATGEFNQILVVKSNDEIGKLTQAFNFMAKELNRTLIEIEGEKNKIETILEYMTDGVIAFNLKGQAIHINPAAKRMLEIEDIQEGFDIFSNKYNIDISIEKFLYLQSPTHTSQTVNLNEKVLRVHFALFTDKTKKVEGVIAVIQDITEQSRLEEIRREFVANVSHELRTPLTSIKSYTETLIDGALEDKPTAERFLGVIDAEADRMARLVKDLLELSKFDHKKMKFDLTKSNLEKLAKDSIEKVLLEAESKKIDIQSYTIGDIPDTLLDKDRIEQVILNVISNAIKYTPQGGKITVYIEKLYNELYLKVIDTGIGIAKKDIPRIFERFYRVDKARSRELGGTGLGLSIAKEIIEAHKGEISVSSELDKGTEVVIKLPIVV